MTDKKQVSKRTAEGAASKPMDSPAAAPDSWQDVTSFAELIERVSQLKDGNAPTAGIKMPGPAATPSDAADKPKKPRAPRKTASKA